MQSTIRFTRRIMTLLLAVVMLFGTLMTTADAANRDNVQHYDTYMCIGDSIAAGFYIDGQRAGYYRTRHIMTSLPTPPTQSSTSSAGARSAPWSCATCSRACAMIWTTCGSIPSARS